MLWQSGEACVALAALLFSASSLFVKLTSDSLSVLEICTLSSSGCAIAVLFLLHSTHASYSSTTATSPLATRTILLVAIRAGLGATTILCYYAAIESIDIRDATALFFTSPLFALVLECLVHRRLPSRYNIVGAAFTAGGALMISHTAVCLAFPGSCFCFCDSDTSPGPADNAQLRDGHAEEEAARMMHRVLHLMKPVTSLATDVNPGGAEMLSMGSMASAATVAGAASAAAAEMNLLGLALAVAAAATNAMAFITIQAISSKVSALCLTFWHHTATAIAAAASQAALLLVASLHHSSAAAGNRGVGGTSGDGSAVAGPVVWFIPGAKDLTLVAGVMAAQLVAQLLLNRGFSLTSPTKGAAINVLQVVFSFVWDSLFLGHKLQVTTAAGGMLIIGGVLVLTASSMSHKQRCHQEGEQLQWGDSDDDAEVEKLHDGTQPAGVQRRSIGYDPELQRLLPLGDVSGVPMIVHNRQRNE